MEENTMIEEMPLSEAKGESLDTVSEPMALSEAVVQSLASALTKIEAYVPTVWVDNTEPSIDSDHLNYVEQAIMRVTNLMNGAVDVIQDLQSQLDAVNSNLGSGVTNPSDADANNYINTGAVTVGNPLSWSNLPSNKEGTLVVRKCGTYILQEYTSYYDGQKSWRINTNNGNSGSWTNWFSAVLTSDLGKFSANAISTSFKTYIANNLSGNGYLIFPFANMTDNPFTFSSGFCVACVSALLNSDVYYLMGFNGTLLETKYISST